MLSYILKLKRLVPEENMQDYLDRLVVLSIVPIIQYFDEGYGDLNYMTLMCYLFARCQQFIDFNVYGKS